VNRDPLRLLPVAVIENLRVKVRLAFDGGGIPSGLKLRELFGSESHSFTSISHPQLGQKRYLFFSGPCSLLKQNASPHAVS
jgi:hypothetical protein